MCADFVKWPKIVNGETVFSWVTRGLAKGIFERPDVLREIVNESYRSWDLATDPGSTWPTRSSIDFEFDMHGGLISALSEIYDVPIAQLQPQFRSTGRPLTKLPFRNLYCEDCFRDSFLAHRFPVWKQEWCYATACYCAVHFQALKAPADIPTVERRMWDCYLDSIWRTRQSVTLSDRYTAIMALKAWAWMDKLFAKDSQVAQSVLILYKLLLCKRTWHARGGVAAAGFGQPRKAVCRLNLGLADRMEYGMHSSNGTQRGGALFLIGWLAGIYSKKDLEGAARGDMRIRRTLPHSPQSLGSLSAQVCMDAAEGSYISNELTPLRGLGVSGVDSFIKGLQNSILLLR